MGYSKIKDRIGRTENVIVMEAEDGDLDDLLKKRESLTLPLKRDEKLSILLTVANTLHTMHSLHISHRDIKPGNILISERVRFDRLRSLQMSDESVSSLLCSTAN